MRHFDCPLCRKDRLMQEKNIRLVTEIDHNPGKIKYVSFHQFICPSCGYVALTRLPEEGTEPESIMDLDQGRS